MLRKWLCVSCAPVALVLMSPTPVALAQSPAPQPPTLTLVFEGGVTSRTGNDVAGANVVVTAPSGFSGRDVTNQLGQFSISRPYIPGPYTVTANQGNLTVSDTVNVPSAPVPPDDRAVRTQVFVVNLAFEGGSKVTGAYVIPVYFATSRRQIAASPPRFGADSNDEGKRLRFGVANVSVPLRHKIGRIEKAWWEFLGDSNKHIMVTGGRDLSTTEFAARSRPPIGSDDVLVFVHGFNVTFQEALETAAQVAYDIGFRGAVILYSWPSGSTLIPLDVAGMQEQYTFAQAQIDQGAEYVQLALLLDEVVRQHKGRVHLLAHSMGAYLSVRAFKTLKPQRAWSNVMFAAPDVAQPVFDAEAPHVVSLTRVLTVYFNPNDRALAASKAQNWKFPRAGAACTRFKTIDCIDAFDLRTSLTRHSYYADNRSILSDIRLVTCLDAPPPQRGLIATKITNAWIVSKVPAAQPKDCGP